MGVIKTGLGESVRNAVTSTINSIGSVITITPFTQATTDGGYSGQTETDSTAVSETAIPFEEFKSIVKQKFGDLETGKLQVALKSTATFDISGSTKYKVTWQGEVYDFVNKNRFTLADTLIAWIVTISKRHD